MKKIFETLFAAGLLLAGSNANAAYVGVPTPGNNPFNNPQGTITLNTCPDDGSSNSCSLTKVYTGLGSMFISFETNSTGDHFLTETITNSTNTDWTDFHWELGQEFGNPVITGVTGIGPFASSTINPTPGSGSLSLSGGVLAAGASFTPTISFNILGGTIGNPGGSPAASFFFIQQYPTFGGTIPEPGTLAVLAFGLVGLGFARRRKAA